MLELETLLQSRLVLAVAEPLTRLNFYLLPFQFTSVEGSGKTSKQASLFWL